MVWLKNQMRHLSGLLRQRSRVHIRPLLQQGSWSAACRVIVKYSKNRRVQRGRPLPTEAKKEDCRVSLIQSCGGGIYKAVTIRLFAEYQDMVTIRVCLHQCLLMFNFQCFYSYYKLCLSCNAFFRRSVCQCIYSCEWNLVYLLV